MADVKKLNGYDIKDEVARQELANKVDDVKINNVSVVENNIANITVDATITVDGENPVKGGAVYDALAEKQDSLPVLEDGKFLSNDGENLIWQTIPSGMTYKGQVETVNDLPNNPQVGDLYNCIADGLNYVWNGEDWDTLATPPLDESNLVHKTGTETIPGNKTFTAPVVIQTNNTWGLDIKSPSSGGYLYVTRGSGNNMCRFALKAGINGGTMGTETNDKFSIRVNNQNKMTFEKNGDIKLISNPIISSNDTQIATTKWVNDKLATSSIYTYKGTVANLADLENIVNPAVGDVYYVTSESNNYAWNGSAWGTLGGTFKIDNALSYSSENAVQNKVITSALDQRALAVKTPDTTTYAVEDGYLQVTPQAAQPGEILEPVNILSIESDPDELTGNTDSVIASSVAVDIYDKINEGSLPEGEPLSLYGTNEDGEPEAYKVKPEIVLHKKVLPEEYEELDYISNTTSIISLGEKTNNYWFPSIEDIKTLKDMFNMAEGAYDKIVKGFKFTYVDSSNSYWNIYAIWEDDTEHLFAENVLQSYWTSAYGLGFYQTSMSNVGDYFLVDKTGTDGNQYIDTGVNIKADVYGEYDEEASQQVDNVNVTVNTTSIFTRDYANYTYVDFRAYYIDGTTDLRWGSVPSGNTYPDRVLTPEELTNYGIVVTGDIIPGDATPQTTGTVVRVSVIKDYDNFSIKTAAKFAASGEGGIILGSITEDGSRGIDIDTLIGGAGYPNINVAGQTSFIPVPLFFQDVNLEVIDPIINGHYLVQFNLKLKVGENEIQARNTSYKTANSITLFANHYEDGIEYPYLPVSLKRTTIWKNNEIVFDGVPCREIATGTVGMYDLISEEFLYSPSETQFVAGNVIEYPYVSTKVLNLTGDENVDIVHGLDNDEYEQLDWLESDGTCAIDLGIKPTLDAQIEVKVKNNNVPSAPEGVRAIYGYYSNTLTERPAFGLRLSGYEPNYFFNLVYCPNSPNTGAEANVCAADTSWHTIKVTPSYVNIDGTNIFHHNTVAASGARSIGLFGAFTGVSQPGSWTLEPSFRGRISYLRELVPYIFNSYTTNIIVHDFVAVRRKSDGELGFYDKVTGAFCTNQGSGTFVAGEAYGIKVIAKPADNVLKTISSNSINKNIINSQVQSSVTITGKRNTILGYDGRAYGDDNVVIGQNANSATIDGLSVVVGSESLAAGQSVGLGYHAQALENYSTAIGYYATTHGRYSIAIGHKTVTGYPHSIEIGDTQTWQNSSTRCVGQYGIAIGDSHQPYRATYSIVMGYGHTIGSTTGGNNTRVISLGYSNLTNGDYDINIGSNTEVSSNYTICLGHQSIIKNNSDCSIAIGKDSIANGSFSMAIGCSARAGDISHNYTSALAIGYSASALANYAISLGYGAYNTEANSLAVGFQNGTFPLLRVDNYGYATIPYGRLTSDVPTDGYCLKYDANSDSLVWGEGGSSIEPATDETLGGIIVGSGLSITAEGVLSANAQPLQPATANRLGGVKVGSRLTVAADGTLSADVQSVYWDDLQGDLYDNSDLSTVLSGLQDNIDDGDADLQSQIDNLQSIGRFLAMWDADTGTARYLPSVPFTYAQGDYYIIASVAAQGGTNYMPDGGTYTAPSTVTTSDPLEISDMYFYTGSVWVYLPNHARAIAVDHDLSTTSKNPVENATITNALDDKQDTLQAGKGISIENNVISTSGDSVGVPQIANVYAKQLNSAEQAAAISVKQEYLGFYSDICFNLNLTKEQIIDKMDELYIGLERFKRNRVTSGLADPEDPESEEISYRDIANFKVQNDHFVHTDRKMYCYRYQNGDYSVYDPRRYTYFYSNFEYSTYQDMFDEDENIYAFYGEYTNGNQASCLNTLRNIGPFQDYEDGDENWERYPDGDIEVFVNVNKDDSIANGYITLEVCRQYIIDGQKEYYWSPDWSDPMTDIYSTSTHKIPTEYTGSLEEVGIVQDLDGYEYVRRPDLNYWSFNIDEYLLPDWIFDILEPNTLHGTPWGEDSVVDSWKCYWLDYPMRPVLLQDCEVKFQGGWARLKDVIARGDEDELPENITFRYPYNSAELWLRFSAWQKRCMYNEYSDERDEYLQLCQKQALVYAWEWDIGYSVINRRAFGRQRNRYSFAGENAKICEYIQFNLYSPSDVSSGTKSKSTPIKKRLVINAANGSSGLRD